MQQEEQPYSEQSKSRAIFDTVRDYAIYTLDAAGWIMSWNRSGERLMGYEKHDVLGLPLTVLGATSELAESNPSSDLLQEAYAKGACESVGWSKRKDGSLFWSDSVVSVLRDANDLFLGFSVVSRDMTKRHEAEEELHRLATTDLLTGLFNRRQFCDVVSHEPMQRRRYRRPLSMLMVDADHLKSINDSWGHDVGDRALVLLSLVLRECCRDSDVVARVGGEEFSVLLSNTSWEGAMIVAERIRTGVMNQPLNVESRSLHLTVSIGVAEVSELSTDFDHLMRDADRALYLAKGAGRNCVKVAKANAVS